MDSWVGHLQTSNGHAVRDIHIYSTHKGRPQPIPHDATLTFVSLVELCLVPLHLVVGPSCVLWTENPDTEAWFRDQLLREPKPPSHSEDGRVESWFDVSNQSYAGILASVSNEGSLNSPPITDVVFFAVVEPSLRDSDLSLQVQAVPLACGLETLQLSPSHMVGLLANNGSISQDRTQSQDVFDAATEIRRRAKGRGGVEVAAAAAGLSQARLLVGHKKSKGVQSQSDAVSQGEVSTSPIEGTERQRLLMRSSSLPNAKQAADRPLSDPASTFLPSNSKDPVSLEKQNKDAISRLVMAGMRLHGYQPRKRKSKLTESASVDETQSFSSDDHKLVYHQTYKAATFIFRNHLQSSGLHLQTEVISETVDHLLNIFSTDPLACE